MTVEGIQERRGPPRKEVPGGPVLKQWGGGESPAAALVETQLQQNAGGGVGPENGTDEGKRGGWSRCCLCTPAGKGPGTRHCRWDCVAQAMACMVAPLTVNPLPVSFCIRRYQCRTCMTWLKKNSLRAKTKAKTNTKESKILNRISEEIKKDILGCRFNPQPLSGPVLKKFF